MGECNGKKDCKGKIILDGKCCRHLSQQCSICLENVKSTNTFNTKRLTCGHSYHVDCILTWFVTSDECPVCRTRQFDDPIIRFKLKVEDELRQKYRDAIESLEQEISDLRSSTRIDQFGSFIDPVRFAEIGMFNFEMDTIDDANNV